MLSKKIIQELDLSSLIELDEFIKSNINGAKTFRYFSKRPYSVIKNHIYTCLYYIDDVCVGYGHLDFEDKKTWLGIIVSDTEATNTATCQAHAGDAKCSMPLGLQFNR